MSQTTRTAKSPKTMNVYAGKANGSVSIMIPESFAGGLQVGNILRLQKDRQANRIVLTKMARRYTHHAYVEVQSVQGGLATVSLGGAERLSRFIGESVYGQKGATVQALAVNSSLRMPLAQSLA